MSESVVEGDTYSKELETKMHQTIKKVTEDYESMKFNTAVASLMELINEFSDKKNINKAEMKTFLILLNPAAPHITEELWETLGFEGMLNQTEWPKWEEEKTVEDTIEMAVQINGKVRGKIVISKDSSQDQAKEMVLADEKLSEQLKDKEIIKEIYVVGRIYNIVVK